MTQQSLGHAIAMLRQQPWSLWWIQFRRYDAHRDPAKPVYTAGMVDLLPGVHSGGDHSAFTCLSISHSGPGMSEDTNVLAGIVQLYYVRLGIFFGCLGIFSRLIRGEMIERSLHYYLLSPVRREVILLSKFFADAVSAVVLFGVAMMLTFVLMYCGLSGLQARTSCCTGRGWTVRGVSADRGAGMPGIRRDFPDAKPDVSQSHAGSDVAAGVGGDQSGDAVAATEVQRGLVSASSDARERSSGGHIRSAHC